jgi:DNA-binding CsgD family transcriptional regulator
MLSLARELAELPNDPKLRTRHMLEGLGRMVGAKGGTSFRARHDFVGNKRRVTVLTGQSTGMEDAAAQAVLGRYMATMLPTDPLGEPLYSQPGRQVTMGREQMLNRTLWHRSDHFNEVRRGIGIDDCIATKITLGAGGHVLTFCLHRAMGDIPFTPRQWHLVDLFHSEMRRLLDAPMRQLEAQLSPRMRQVLECMMAGDGAKQIAAKLNLSVHTVRDYIKELYQRFNVSGRGELLACFARQ